MRVGKLRRRATFLCIDLNWEISYHLCMGRSISKAQKELYYHTWEDNEVCGVYRMRNYNMSYITITRWMPGEKDPVTSEIYTKIQFIPTINGTRLHDKGTTKCDITTWKFDTLEEAKTGAMYQIDKNTKMNMNFKYTRIKRD